MFFPNQNALGKVEQIVCSTYDCRKMILLLVFGSRSCSIFLKLKFYFQNCGWFSLSLMRQLILEV